MKVMASGINFADVHARTGLYNGPDGAPSCPAVLGMEGAGVVIQTGDGVQNMEVIEIHYKHMSSKLKTPCLLLTGTLIMECNHIGYSKTSRLAAVACGVYLTPAVTVLYYCTFY